MDATEEQCSDGFFGHGSGMVKLGRFVEEFFEETSWRDFGPDPPGGGASLEREEDLILTDGIEAGEIATQTGV